MNANLPAQQLKDVEYGSFPSSKMDVSLPANRNKHTPFVIIMHGGAWTLGDKVWGSRTQDTLTAHGIASININYRYADDYATHYQELLLDIDSALDYCVAHADEWHTRKTNFIMNGESAGAHLALLYGYTTNKKISTIIAECAPTNLADTSLLNYYIKKDTSLFHAIYKMVGATYDRAKPLPAAFGEASPVTQVKNIPTLFFHGTADPVVPYTQATMLETTLKSKGYTYKLVPMIGAAHDLGFNTAEGRKIIYGEMVSWIEKYGR